MHALAGPKCPIEMLVKRKRDESSIMIPTAVVNYDQRRLSTQVGVNRIQPLAR